MISRRAIEVSIKNGVLLSDLIDILAAKLSVENNVSPEYAKGFVQTVIDMYDLYKDTDK